MIKRVLGILSALTVWTAVTFYFVKAVSFGGGMTDTITVRRLDVTVTDSVHTSVLSAEDVRKWIDSAGLDPVGRPLKAAPVAEVLSLTSSQDFVRRADVWTDLRGTMSVRITQRAPLMRIAGGRGYDLYVTDDGCILPARPGSSQYVPVVTGDVPLPSSGSFLSEKEEKNVSEGSEFLGKLLTFVSYIAEDPFWNAMIVQIDVRKEAYGREIVLVPRAGNYLILLGEIDGFRERLDRMRAFYRTRTCRGSMGRWSTVDLRYDDQIVCTN